MIAYELYLLQVSFLSNIDMYLQTMRRPWTTGRGHDIKAAIYWSGNWAPALHGH